MDHNGTEALAPAAEKMRPTQDRARVTPYVVITCILAGTGGLMYGYDMVIAGGISIMDDFLLKFYPRIYAHKIDAKEDNYCKYNNQVFQLFSSSLYLAAVVATIFAALVSKRLGRKVTMVIGGIFYVAGTVVGTAAQNLAMILLGRVLLGCGLGFANQAIPIYLSEIAPPQLRGGLTILFVVYVAIGILLGGIVNYVALKVHPWGWRLSLGVAGIPSLIIAVCSCVVVESPSSLLERGKPEQAREVLRKIRGSEEISEEFDELVEVSRRGTARWEGYKELFCERKHRGELVIACLVPFFQQACGDDAILFYGTFLFKLGGFGDKAALYSAIIIGGIGLLTCSGALVLVDKVGRRGLLLFGCALMGSTLVVLGSIFGATLKGDVNKLPRAEGIVEVVMVCVFVVGFVSSLAPLAWVIPSEILSQNVRSAGQSMTVLVNMLFKFVIAQTFLSMLCAFKFWIFIFFAGWVLVIAMFVVFFLPETKRIPLYNMEKVWQEHWFWKHIVTAPSSHVNPNY